VSWFPRAAAKPDRDPRGTGYAIHRHEKEMRRLQDVLEPPHRRLAPPY